MRTFEEYLALTEQHLTDPMPAIGAYAETLEESMKYSLLSGGKRIRPVMLLAAAEMAGGTAEEALPYASAIEFIHTYSLIHDDLPAMDDDALRRGRPTNHMVYGAGMATLAGDGLLSAAFEIMLGDMLAHQQDPEALRRRVRAADAIARGAGVRGMVAGQTADLTSESERPSAPLLTFIHENKTAAMIIGAIRAGLFLGDAEEALQNDMERYAYDLGMAFQVADDILDVVGTINIILGNPTATSMSQALATAEYTIEDGLLYLDSPVSLAGLQVQFMNENGEIICEPLDILTGMENVSSLKDENGLFMSYSFRGRIIPAGRHAILRVGDAQIEAIIVSDVQGHEVQVNYSMPTIIENITSEQHIEKPQGMFDLMGRKMQTPRKGVYVIDGKKVCY